MIYCLTRFVDFGRRKEKSTWRLTTFPLLKNIVNGQHLKGALHYDSDTNGSVGYTLRDDSPPAYHFRTGLHLPTATGKVKRMFQVYSRCNALVY